MLGLCSICGKPVVRNAMRCADCQAILDAELARLELQRARAANECYTRWMNGEIMVENAAQSSVQSEPKRQPQRKHTRGQRRRGDAK